MGSRKKLETKIKFAGAPALIAAWPGVGSVGTVAIDFLRHTLQARPMGVIDLSSAIAPTSVTVKEGRILRPESPRGELFYNESPALILLSANTLFAENSTFSLVQSLVDAVEEIGARTILTIGAFPCAVDHRAQPRVCFATADEALSREYTLLGIEPFAEGEISGPLGLVPSIASMHGMRAACLMAGVPSYVGTAPYPKAALMVLRKIAEVLEIPFDLSDLEEAVRSADSVFEMIERQVRASLPLLFPSDPDNPPERSEPASRADPVRARIEELFTETSRDRSKAAILKQVLDTAGLFGTYEDRFLDLFKSEE